MFHNIIDQSIRNTDNKLTTVETPYIVMLIYRYI